MTMTDNRIKRRRRAGRPPAGAREGEKVKDYPQLSIRVPVELKARLNALSAVTGLRNGGSSSRRSTASSRTAADDRELVDGLSERLRQARLVARRVFNPNLLSTFVTSSADDGKCQPGSAVTHCKLFERKTRVNADVARALQLLPSDRESRSRDSQSARVCADRPVLRVRPDWHALQHRAATPTARETGRWSASAIGSMRAINSGELTFALTCGNGFYAPY